MKNPVNRLATSVPRALDSLLETKTMKQEEDGNKQQQQKKQKKKERTCSFDLDLSGLNLLDNSSINGGGTLGSGSTIGSINEECNGSVVTFEELDGWDMVNSSTDLMFEKPSPN